jgi:hypothetical protein
MVYGHLCIECGSNVCFDSNYLDFWKVLIELSIIFCNPCGVFFVLFFFF